MRRKKEDLIKHNLGIGIQLARHKKKHKIEKQKGNDFSTQPISCTLTDLFTYHTRLLIRDVKKGQFIFYRGT